MPEINYTRKKRLLYRSKIEGIDWAVNYILGCAHGCKFPCYAMMMAKRFGWVENYNEWINPRIVENATDLLYKEIKKYRKKIKFVYLSIMTDPFMYDIRENELIPEIKSLTLEIISLFNKNKIKVVTLTKGFYPEELLLSDFLRENEYGITLVSLNNEFKRRFEPYSAPYQKRISSLYRLHKEGLKTWVIIEPFPTPNLDPTADNIYQLLKRISFVDEIIFGKMNYNPEIKYFKEYEKFYRRTSQIVKNFCNEHKIRCNIISDTPQ